MKDIPARGVVLYLALLVGALARGADYEVVIDVDSEAELYELYAQREISEETLNTLVDLLQDGVDLRTASRDELYLLPQLTWAQVDAILAYRKLTPSALDPAVLVQAQILSAEELSRLAPFLLVTQAEKLPLSGKARLLTAYANADTQPPPWALQARAAGLFDLSAGLALFGTRRWLGPVVYDPSRDALAAPPLGYGVQLPKYYLRWKASGRQVVVGTFRLGFGQRLTLDNTSRETPRGVYPDDVVHQSFDLGSLCRLSRGELSESPCTEAEQRTYVTRDFSWRDSFRGVAVSLIELGVGEQAQLSAHAFGSYQSRAVYQYDLFDRRYCSDPHSTDSGCSSPAVYLRQRDVLAPAPRYAYMTLPEAWDELAVGGNVSFAFSPRVRLGLTGYRSAPSWRTGEVQGDFQESVRYPYGGPFGALGADLFFAAIPLNVFLEAARSFDSMPGSVGGFAALLRTVLSFTKQEFEASARYYDRGYKNPYARPTSAADEFEGGRARNEAGVRLEYRGKPTLDWRVSSSLDLWTLPQDGSATQRAGTANVAARVRADFVGYTAFAVAGWVDYRNKNLAVGGRGQCYETLQDTEAPADSQPQDPVGCAGEFGRAALEVTVRPLAVAKLGLGYSHELVDDTNYKDRYRQDHLAWVKATLRPFEPLTVYARVRYLHEGLDRVEYREQSLWGLAEATLRLGRPLSVGLRYDLVAHLDQRESTRLRRPNPEHQLRLSLEGKL